MLCVIGLLSTASLCTKVKQRLVLQVTVLSDVKLLTLAAMVDNLAEKVDKWNVTTGRCLCIIGTAKTVCYME